MNLNVCFKFLESNENHPYDLVINNHLGMDGLLSVFVLTYPTVASPPLSKVIQELNRLETGT